MEELAIFGGPKTVDIDFVPYNPIGKEEVDAAKSVVESGVLSEFLGLWNPEFYGGRKVQEFERAWKSYFDIKHALTVNSCTSGLIAAVGAIGIEPGDEVIVSPWTMSASATSILVWNAIPVFADIEQETFNLDPESIKKNTTLHTKAIIVPNIFGHPADLDQIMEIADEHKLNVIEDNAQAPGAIYKGKYAGTVADIGVFSLNRHKHIHTGEGGVCVTNNSELAERMQLIRNHAEAVIAEKEVADICNMIGFNFRMTEIEAAIGLEQLKKLEKRIEERIYASTRLAQGLSGLKGLRTPIVKNSCTHVYYVFPLLFDSEQTGVSRDVIVKALHAEGVSVSNAYANVHLLPLYQKKIAYGRRGFPWTAGFYKGNVSYEKGICPVAEKFQAKSYIGIGMCTYQYSEKEINLINQAFHKVWENLGKLVHFKL